MKQELKPRMRNSRLKTYHFIHKQSDNNLDLIPEHFYRKALGGVDARQTRFALDWIIGHLPENDKTLTIKIVKFGKFDHETWKAMICEAIQQIPSICTFLEDDEAEAEADKAAR